MKAFRSGFTLVELLAVVVMLAILATIHLSAHARAVRPTKIAQCASNLRQFALASQVLAIENDGKFPENTSGTWPWDIQRSTLNSLDQHGVNQRILYCPGTAPNFGDSENASLYNFTPGRGIIGYATTFPGGILVSTNVNFTLIPSAIPLGPTFFTPTPSTRVLLADATISLAPIPTAAGNFTVIPTAAVSGKSYTSPHLSGKIPLGGNVGMLDGHVEWRKFSNMMPRTSGVSAPYFWW